MSIIRRMLYSPKLACENLGMKLGLQEPGNEAIACCIIMDFLSLQVFHLLGVLHVFRIQNLGGKHTRAPCNGSV